MVSTEEDILKNAVDQTVHGKYVPEVRYLVTNILQNILFLSSTEKERKKQVWNNLRTRKRWQNVGLGVNFCALESTHCDDKGGN